MKFCMMTLIDRLNCTHGLEAKFLNGCYVFIVINFRVHLFIASSLPFLHFTIPDV